MVGLAMVITINKFTVEEDKISMKCACTHTAPTCTQSSLLSAFELTALGWDVLLEIYDHYTCKISSLTISEYCDGLKYSATIKTRLE